MPKINWENRIKAANTRYEAWESKFECKKAERYYENFQNRYTNNRLDFALNMIFATVQGKLASTVLQNPSFLLTPLPGTDRFDQEAAASSAQTKQDLINTISARPEAGLVSGSKLAALDSFFRFGVMEVIYASDSKNAYRDITPEEDDSQEDPAAVQSSVQAAPQTPVNPATPDAAPPEGEDELKEEILETVSEGLYFNHIPAAQFRISTSSQCDIEACTWCGYYFYVPATTLLDMPKVRFTKEMREFLENARDSDESTAIKVNQKDEYDGTGVKVWKIFDNVKHEKLLFLDNFKEKPFLRATYIELPISDYRPIPRPPTANSWYPIPPVWFWLQQQDEINAGRHSIHLFRKRFLRKFYGINVAVEEQEKFKSEADCEIINVASDGAIKPIPNPDIGSSITFDAITSKDDFNTVAGVSTARQSDRTTATQARINANRESIRESAEQIDFKVFLAAVGAKALKEILNRYENKIQVRRASAPEDMFGSGEAENYYPADPIKLADDGYGFLVRVNVQDESPAVLQEELNKMVSFLSLLTQFPMVAKSPKLIFETAYKCGYRNHDVIREMQKMAMMQQLGEAAALRAQNGQSPEGGNPANNLAKNTLNSQAANSIGAIDAQIQESTGGTSVQ